MNKTTCPKCRQGTSPKQFREAGMCAMCARIWTRYGFDQTLANVPVEAEKLISEMFRAGKRADQIAPMCRREWPLAHPNRDWDATLVILVDGRRLRRAA